MWDPHASNTPYEFQKLIHFRAITLCFSVAASKGPRGPNAFAVEIEFDIAKVQTCQVTFKIKTVLFCVVIDIDLLVHQNWL